MITLYKYMFYSISYVVRKYDRLWDVGDTYFVGGGMLMGWMITATFMDVSDFLGIFWPLFSSTIYFPYIIFMPLILGVSICIYLWRGKRYDKIYSEMDGMDRRKRRLYKILNIIHLIIVNAGQIVLAEYIRNGR